MVSLYREIARFLEENAVPDAEFDARCILEQVTGQRLEQLTSLTDAQAQDARGMAARRAKNEPLQYILGEWEFFGMRLFVGKGVLIPRPDTEVLVETVLDWCKSLPKLRILDLCTGSGCIALALQKHLPHAEVHAVDLSEAALAYARKNADYHGLPVIFHQADVTKPQDIGRFDVIVSNPPYLNYEEMANLQTELRHEPALALAAGADGLRFYRSITRIWKASLNPAGLLAYEIGEQQGEAVSGILRENGFAEVRIVQDYAHHDRVVFGKLPNVS